MNREEEKYHQVASKIENAEQSQLFGKPCYKINKKAFCCFFQNEMVFKLTGDDHQVASSFDGSQLFDPSGKGRAMKEWVQVPYEYAEDWQKFAKAASEYVGSIK